MRRRRSRSAGFTLLEVALSAALLAMVLGSAALVTITSTDAYQENSSHARAAFAVRQALVGAARQLAATGLETLTPDPVLTAGVVSTGTSTLRFTPIVGASATAPVWDNARQLQLVYSPGEANDGVDNDADGVVDNCQLELVLDAGLVSERTVVLVKHVREFYAGELPNGADDNGNGLADERGFHVTRVGSLMTVRICVEAPGRGGASQVDTLETSIDVRN